MKKIGIICALSATFLLGDGGNVSWKVFAHQNEKPKTRLTLRSTSEDLNVGFYYINNLRKYARLNMLTRNASLDSASENHNNYLLFHQQFRHTEESTKALFTGVNPDDRGSAAGYASTYYSENISGGDSSVTESINGLIQSPYQRINFLHYDASDIGIGSGYDINHPYGSIYTYNIGNTTSDLIAHRASQPDYVIWPANRYEQAQLSYGNLAIPSANPECSPGGVSGNPITVVFNPNSGSIVLQSFKLFFEIAWGDDEAPHEVINTKLLTPATDTNLESKQFVLFPLESLTPNARYRVEIAYTEDGVSKTANSKFATTYYPMSRYEVFSGQTYSVKSGKTYLLHVKPSDCTESLITMQWDRASTLVERIGIDLIKVTATENTVFDFGNGITFGLTVGTDDNAISPVRDPSKFVPIITYMLL
jgi:uncharacterized protein YkwD